MKMNLSILTVLLILPMLLTAGKQTCNCAENINEIIKKTEENYAGFPTKVNAQTRPAYNQLVKTIKAKAALENDARNCFYLAKEYIRFFKDKHFSFTYQNTGDPDNEIIPPGIARDYKKAKPDNIEGRWINPDTSISINIIKVPGNEYKAVILEASDKNLQKGLVYFSLKPHKKGFLLKQHNVYTSTEMYARQRGGLLQLWNFALFGKVYPTGMTAEEKTELSKWRDNNNGLDFKMLDDESSYIKIPTFFNNDNKISKLIAAHDKEIRNSKYLVIDLRGNGGGNAGWSYLLPYVLTNPIKQDAPLLRISPDNVKIKKADLEYVVKNPIPEEAKKYYPDEYIASLRNTYEKLSKLDGGFYAVPGITIPVDEVLAQPSKVALITDDLCGSATEYFFKLMEQSKKTIRYGVNSVGMMDYEGPTVVTPLPFKQFILMIPVSKSSWADTAPIDENGFNPDVRLSVPGNEWTDYVLKDLKRRELPFAGK
ncbi:S41 family peptidase [Chitinophaga polysaccharea]|uniref:S41 family peptidase n=1 Tax=Chitinophaga polysaccharea TaxID=1293035 RepID=UPI0011579466|nr:S41 family peptidase [Chitinophaga polysaccharea]